MPPDPLEWLAPSALAFCPPPRNYDPGYATAQNTYYHADVSCIKKNNPDFKSVRLEISTDVKNSLKGEHKAYYDNILTLHCNVISNFSVKIYGNVFLIAHKCNTRSRR